MALIDPYAIRAYALSMALRRLYEARAGIMDILQQAPETEAIRRTEEGLRRLIREAEDTLAATVGSDGR